MARSERFNVELTATDAASQVINQVAEARDGLSEAPVNIEITAEDDASDKIEDVEEAAEDLDGTTAETELSADDEASDVIEDVTDAVDELDGATAEAELSATDDATGTIADVSGAVEDLDGDSASVDISVDGDDASDVTAVSDALSDLDTAPDASASLDVEGADEADGAIGSIMENLGALGTGAVAGLAAGALSSVFAGAADHALEVRGLADATGDTLTNASGVVEQFDFIGVSAKQVLGMVGRVNDKIAASPALAEQLGITISENQTPLETFVGVVDALNSGQLTANERLSLATEIFGRKGALSVLAIGTQVGNVHDAIEDMPEWQVVTDQDVKAAIDFKTTMDELGDQAAEVAQQLLSVVGPALATAFGLFSDLGGAINAVFSLGQSNEAGSVWQWVEAFPTDQFNAIGELLDENGVSAEALRENYFHLSEVQGLLAAGIPPEVIATADLTREAIDFLGQSMAETGDVARAFSEALSENKISTQEWADITADGVITMGEVEAAIQDADVALAEGVTAVDNYAAAYDESVAAIEAHKAALESDIEAIDEQIEKLEEQAEAIAGGGEAYLDLGEAQRDALNAIDDYNESLEVSEDDTRSVERVARDQQDALDDVTRSYIRVADETVNAADQQAKANGTTLTAIQRTDAMNTSLLTSAATLKGPMQTELLAYILRINGIPESKITEILTDTDPNDLAQVERELANASRSRDALIQARMDQNAAAQAAYELRVLTTPRSVLISPIFHSSGGGPDYTYAGGSPFTPAGMALVGEEGPELVRMPIGAAVFRADQTDEMMRRVSDSSSGGTTIHMNTIHMPAGTASSYVNQIRRYVRRNGSTVGQPIP